MERDTEKWKTAQRQIGGVRKGQMKVDSECYGMEVYHQASGGSIRRVEDMDNKIEKKK